MGFDTLRPIILTKLTTLVPATLVAAKDFHTENTTGYPYASFEPSGLSNEYFTNTDNLREYAFQIIVYQEMTKAGRDNCIENLGKAVDAITTLFDTDTTLRAAGAHYVNALPNEWGEYVSKAGPVKYAKMTLVIGVEIGVV